MRRTLALPLLLLAACGGPTFEQPDASTFRDGPCRAVAGNILSAGKLAHEIGASRSPSTKVRTDLKTAQDGLIAVRPALPTELSKPMEDLIVAIGLSRLRADSNSYDVSVTKGLASAYDGVVTACTT